MSVPPPHERILQHVGLTEQGLRELEIWLLGRLGAGRGGLQYHKARHYGAHNIGDWLDVAVTNGQLGVLENSPGSTIGALFKSATPGIGIAWRVLSADSVVQEYGFNGNDLIGYLGGGQDIIYTQGGRFFRNTGGADFSVYLSDGVEHNGNSGNYNVYADDSAGGGDGESPGSVNYYLGDTGSGDSGSFEVNTGRTVISIAKSGNLDGVTVNADRMTVTTRDEDFTVNVDAASSDLGNAVFNLGTAFGSGGSTFVINDHLGSPLVTYTG